MRPEIVVDLAAVRHNVRTLAELVAPAAVMTVVKADGYGHGIVEVAPRGPGRRRRAGSAWPRSPRRSRCATPATPGRILCWLTLPADVEDGSLARAVAPTSTSRRTPSTASTRSSAAGGEPARPAQGRHRPLARRRRARRLAGAGRRGRRARARGPGPDHRRLVALRLQRRARPPGQRPAGAALPRRARGRRGGGAAARGPPPRQLRRRDPAAEQPLRPGAVRARVVRPRPRARAPTTTSALRPAMTVRAPLALAKRDRQGRGRLLRPHLGRRRGDHRRAGAGRVRRRRAAPRQQPCSRSRSAAYAGRCAAGSAWTRSSSTSAATCRIPASEVVLFGPGDHGEPTAQEWAEACGTISYEIVTTDRRPAAPPLRRRTSESGREHRPPGPRGRGRRRRRRGGRHRPARRPAAPDHRPARGRRPDAVRLAALAAADRGRRRRRPAARRGRRARPDAGGRQAACAHAAGTPS